VWNFPARGISVSSSWLTLLFPNEILTEMKYAILILILMVSFPAFPQKTYDPEWKQADSLSNLGQPRSALEIADKIYQETRAENNTAQFLKASIYRMALKAGFEEDYIEKDIREVESELTTARGPVKNILHSVLAELYWRFYESNRFEFLDRTTVTGFQPDDIRTWDLRRIVQKCIENYTASLENSDFLKSIPIGQFDAILLAKPESRAFRPTLFDFLSHRAIDFYLNTETGLTQPAARFLVDKPDYFLPATEFSGMNIETTDTVSFEFQAIRLLQQLLAMHKDDKDPRALIDDELKRYSFLYGHCILPEKDSLYLIALQKLEHRFLDHPSSTEVSYEIASHLQNTAQKYKPLASEAHKWDLKQAYLIADAAIHRFPDSYGANNCKVLMEQIRKPSLEITTDYASVPGKPALALVSYKNTGTLYFRLFRADPYEERTIAGNSTEDLIDAYRNRQPILTWSQNLPDDGDYQQHSVEIRLPAAEAGYYVMLAGSDEAFPKDAIVTLNRFWRTGITYISRRSDEGSYELFVAGRQEGQPLSKVKTQCFYREYNYNNRAYSDIPGPVLYSGKDGFLTIPPQKGDRHNQYFLEFSTSNDRFITESYFSGYYYRNQAPRKITTTHFFTDRAIYRPGQTVFFKGIVIGRLDKDVSVNPGYHTVVTFYDVNGQKVASQEVVANEFGSFSGSFVSPQNVLTGSMNIQCETGNISVQVEEYKRPKFEVSFNPVQGAYKLGETIEVKGKAMAYAGNALTDAGVSFRVVRTARYPYMWWGWRDWMPESPGMEILNGISTTGPSGEFIIRFTAIPDPTVGQKFKPVFNYEVYATVTDQNGETHDGETSVSVGYNALLVNLDIPGSVNLDSPLQFSLSTTNLNGQKEPAKGTISIWKLREPDRLLRNRNWSRPDKFILSRQDFEKEFPNDIYDNEGEISSWEKDKQVWSSEFNSPADSIFRVAAAGWKPGQYMYLVVTTDAFGEKVETSGSFLAFSPSGKLTPGSMAQWLTVLKDNLEPGDVADIVLGTAAKNVTAIFEVQQNDKILSRKILDLSQEQCRQSIPVNESHRGNFVVNFTFVKMNRSYQVSRPVIVPWTNKKLDITFASFRSKLLPGQEEEWQVKIAGSKGEKVAAELLAGMYDASLDVFMPHSWNFSLFSPNYSRLAWDVTSAFGSRGSVYSLEPATGTAMKFREYDALNWFGFQWFGGPVRFAGGIKVRGIATMDYKAKNNEQLMQIPDAVEEESTIGVFSNAGAKGLPPAATKGTETVSQPAKMRSDFSETAFFYPQLSTNDSGEVVIRFKIPESLTRWKMMGLAYTKDLRIGQIEKTLVTQKDLMVFPNVPRFFREGDRMLFSTKISNISSGDLNGTAELHFFDAYTMKPLDNSILQGPASVTFGAVQGASSTVNWQIAIPEGLQAIVYRVSASAGSFSDGEEAAVPVMTNRMLVTESMPLPVNAGQTKDFTFTKLINSGKSSSTLRNYRLSLEFTSNPAWYAVQALPYLMEYPYECAEQVFSRYYANSIATFIANSDPKIKRVFDSWKMISPDALKSNLEKNQELKNILLEESPWVREAANESERKQRISILFDLNRMSNELGGALKKLADMQAPNGGWPWFAGMPDNRYITQHIVTGLGHLDHLGVIDKQNNARIGSMLRNAVQYLDARMAEDFEKVKKLDKDYLKNDHLGYEDIQYLYARSYFLTDIPIEKNVDEAFGYYRNQAATYWKTKGNYLKGMIALALNRLSDTKTPALILRSMSETALHNEEMGMYWRNEQKGWFWHQAPVETQALMIEAYDEVLNDTKSVDELKVWLLKQKQTQDWKTTKATTEAVYALLLRGTDLLLNDKPASIQVGSVKVDPNKLEGSARPEAGTGYFKTSWSASEITPDMGKVRVTNPNTSIAWGALYWQYFEQLDRITSAETPLSLRKQLFREMNTPSGPMLEPVNDTVVLHLGDKVVVRVELRTDRDMEYVHLKDMRASAFEPLNVISGYKWQGGLGYYESTRDASSNFFISYLPKGTYVFEYRLFATQRGEFSNGITSVQCMYAPEFSAHSEGIRVKVE